MLSSHLYLGLPCDFLVRGFQLNILLTVHLKPSVQYISRQVEH
jgi:hypothetical protein